MQYASITIVSIFEATKEVAPSEADSIWNMATLLKSRRANVDLGVPSLKNVANEKIPTLLALNTLVEEIIQTAA